MSGRAGHVIAVWSLGRHHGSAGSLVLAVALRASRCPRVSTLVALTLPRRKFPRGWASIVVDGLIVVIIIRRHHHHHLRRYHHHQRRRHYHRHHHRHHRCRRRHRHQSHAIAVVVFGHRVSPVVQCCCVADR